jgi:transposase
VVAKLIRRLGLRTEKIYAIESAVSVALARVQAEVFRKIRSGEFRRRDAQMKYSRSAALIHTWLTQFDRGDTQMQGADPVLIAEYEARIAALARKVGQLTMELDLQKKVPRLRHVSGSESSSIIGGPKVAPSEGGAK